METNNKLREALSAALEQVNKVYDILSKPCVVIEEARQCCREARGVLIPALEVPVKNCEVGSPEEQFARFKKFCARFDCCDCPVRKKWNFKPTGDESCLLLWTSMPYEEKGEVAEPPKQDEIKIPEVPPRLEPCPKCGKDAAQFIHPAFDGGSYVSCAKCHFSPQAETWAYTDAEAAVRWNNMDLRKVSADDGN